MNYIAYCTKGLEKLIEREICLKFPDAAISGAGDKRIIFSSAVNSIEVTKLKTVDDIGFLIKEIESIDSLDRILLELKNTDLHLYKVLLSKNRKITNNFSITASIVGGKLKSKEVVAAVSKVINEKYSWEYTEFDHSNFDVRIFIDHKKCYISVRITCESLHSRSYKTISRIGSLRPTVAAAMIMLAGGDKAKLKIIDDFCGSGTILCEALEMGNDAYGGDIEQESVSISKANIANLGISTRSNIQLLDATQTHWQNQSFDAAISNLPWDKQIRVSSITNLYRETLQEYRRIVKPNGVVCLLVSKPELLIKHAKKIFSNWKIVSYKLGLLGQSPTIVVISSSERKTQGL